MADLLVSSFWRHNMVHVDASGESHIVGRTVPWATVPMPVIVDERVPNDEVRFTTGADGTKWRIVGTAHPERPVSDLPFTPSSDPPNLGAPQPRRCGRHRWARTGDGPDECVRCGTVRDPERSRRGR